MSVMMITALYNVSGILTSKKRGCAWGATSFYRFIGVSALFDNSLLVFIRYYSLIQMCTSRNCFSSTVAGAPIITSCASAVTAFLILKS